MSEQAQNDLGVDEKYADELQERVDPPGEGGPIQKVRDYFSETSVSRGEAALATSGIVFLANAVREVRRRAPNHSVEKMAVSILLDDLEGAAEEGQLFRALRQEDPGDFLDGLVEYVIGKAQSTIEMLGDE